MDIESQSNQVGWLLSMPIEATCVHWCFIGCTSISCDVNIWGCCADTTGCVARWTHKVLVRFSQRNLHRPQTWISTNLRPIMQQHETLFWNFRYDTRRTLAKVVLEQTHVTWWCQVFQLIVYLCCFEVLLTNIWFWVMMSLLPLPVQANLIIICTYHKRCEHLLLLLD